jgi:hypothetical protein
MRLLNGEEEGSMYPVAYQADYVEKQGRLITFFRYFVVIPWILVGIFWAIGAFVCTVAAWFALVITGRYPEALYAFNAKAHRYMTRTNSFYYLMTDRWPPFDGDEHPEYPVRLVVPPPLESYSRWKAALRLILAIPIYIVAYLLSLLIGIVVILSWIVIVITGKHPRGLFDVLRLGVAYLARAGTYFGLLTETWPPLSEDDAGSAPQPPEPAPAGPPI